MAESSRLAAHRARVSAGNDPEDPKPNPDDRPEEDEQSPSDASEEEENEMPDKPTADAVAEAKKEGFTEANDRFKTVLASEHYAGREKLAANLLGNDKLSADEIIAALGDAPKAGLEPKANDDQPAKPDAEAAAREVMKAAIDETGNSNIDPDGGKPAVGRAKARDRWDKANAKFEPAKKGA